MKCSKCGTHVQWDEKTQGQCPQCGTLSLSGRVPLEENAIINFLNQHLRGIADAFVHPHIPEKKLVGIRGSYGATLGTQPILAVYDATLMGSASEGFCVTAWGIGWKNKGQGANALPWKEVCAVDLTDDNDIVLGDETVETLYDDENDGDRALQAWKFVLATLSYSAHPPSQDELLRASAGAAPQGSARVLTNTQGWPMVNPVEQLPSPPYRVRDDEAVVRVHPSGEVFVVADGAALTLRHASNGVSMFTHQAPNVVIDVQFSPDGRTLAVLTEEGDLQFLDPYTRQVSPGGHTFDAAASSLAWTSPTDVAVATDEGSVWRVRGGVLQDCLVRGNGANDEPRLACAGDGVLFVAVDERIAAYDLATRVPRYVVCDRSQARVNLTLAPAVGALVAAGDQGIVLYDSLTGEARARVPFMSPLAVAWTTKGKLGVHVSVTDALFGGDALSVSSSAEDFEVAFGPRPKASPQGDLVASQDSVGNLTILDLRTAQLHRFPRVQGRAWIEDLAWMPDGTHLFVAMADGTLALWNVRTMQGIFHVARS